MTDIEEEEANRSGMKINTTTDNRQTAAEQQAQQVQVPVRRMSMVSGTSYVPAEGLCNPAAPLPPGQRKERAGT